LSDPSITVAEFGPASADHALTQRFEDDLTRAELTSLPLTLIILVIAFGALVAAGLPVLLAFSAVLAAVGLNSLVSHIIPTDAQTVSSVILMIGMAVGRGRQNTDAGPEPAHTFNNGKLELSRILKFGIG
jgi:uncharacterized membrane protein YdfJ with MMPL/SSD domain